MDPLHLESQVQRITATGAAPFMVVATAGLVYCLEVVKLGIFIVDKTVHLTLGVMDDFVVNREL
jgi:hypothetical protein